MFTRRAEIRVGFRNIMTITETAKTLTLMAAILTLSACASLLNPDFIQKSEPTENETGSMEPYVDCIRDKKRDETDAPCILK